MLWTKKGDKIIENFLDGDKKQLEKLQNKLFDEKYYQWKNVIYCNERQKIKGAFEWWKDYEWVDYEGYRTIIKKNIRPISSLVVSDAFDCCMSCNDRSESEWKNIKLFLMFNSGYEIINQQQQFNLVKKLVNSDLSDEDLNEALTVVLPDFAIFTTEVLDIVDFNPISEYSISELKELSKKDSYLYSETASKASKILKEYEKVAEENSKVLNLAKKIRNR